jgi:hypothetical protein
VVTMKNTVSWDVMLSQVNLFLRDLFLFSNWDWAKSSVPLPPPFKYYNFEFEIEQKANDSDFELRK